MERDTDPAAPWNERYGATDYFYGTEPNGFLVEVSARIPSGPVMCLADGEGRNAVHLATAGHPVSSVDLSARGVEKARALASARGVEVDARIGDLSSWDLGDGVWSGVVSIFAHVPSTLRRDLHARVVRSLVPGGVFVLEAYTPAQLAHGTGGPKDEDLLMTLEALAEELVGLEIVIGREIERDVVEGAGHTGLAATVQVLARKPGD